jgi:outer membrane protein OmpA-like peptidoglycan-associated protein
MTKSAIRVFLTAAIAGSSLSPVGAEASAMNMPPINVPADKLPPTIPGHNSTLGTLEEGKTLYEGGQYVAALDKFMKVLRRDPQQPEARMYLRMVVDRIRASGMQNTMAPTNPHQSEEGRLRALTEAVPQPALQEEVKNRMRQRHLLTLDLSALPGVTVNVDSQKGRVEIKSSMLFAEKMGGLKEEGIPILDRVAAWLRTFGQQPVTINCYPEEFQDPAVGGSLFLHRYAQLYGFFVDERKLPAVRFVNAELMKTPNSAKGNKIDPNMAKIAGERPQVMDKPLLDGGLDIATDSDESKIVITSIGGGAIDDDVMMAQVPRWLEFAILPSHTQFDPQEGDWTSIDLSAITVKGVRSWEFKIVPANAKPAAKGKKKNAKTEKSSAGPMFYTQGSGNMLKRLSWDGRNFKSGSFAPPGNYIAQLRAVDNEGKDQTHQVTLRIQRAGHPENFIADQTPPPAAKQQRSASKPKPKPVAAVAAPTETEPTQIASADKPPVNFAVPSTEELLAEPMEMERTEKSTRKPQSVAKPAPKPKPAPVIRAEPEPVEPAPAPVVAVPKPAPMPVVAAVPKPVAPKPVAPPRVEKPLPPPPPPVVEAKPAPVAVEKPTPPPPPAPVEEKSAPVAAPAETAAPESQDSDSAQAIWKQVIQFENNESDLKPTLKASLERIGKTLEVYPLQKVRILGFADGSESNPNKLARQRAEMVRDTLINEYGVDARRVIIAGGRVRPSAAGRSSSKVEISITN